ncbi:hypothetical protein D3C79_881640 [compost metagenome]
MHQQHGTGQTRWRGHFLFEVEEDVARVVRIEVLHLVAEDELIGEVHQAVGAVLLRRSLGYQTADATTTVAGDVVPDNLDATLGDRERYCGLEVVQPVAAFDQRSRGGILLDCGEHIVRHRGASMGLVHRDLEGLRVALEHRHLAW